MTAIPNSTNKEHEIAIKSQHSQSDLDATAPVEPGSGAPLDPAIAERHSPQGQSLGDKMKEKVDQLKGKIFSQDGSTGIEGMDSSTIKREAKHQDGQTGPE